jgi:GNAT superfamily N-acetyltransferase
VEPRCIEADDAAKVERDALSHAAWGEGLDVARFQAREARLRATRFARKAMRTWLLVEGERTVASMETFEVASRLHGHAGRSFAIASVFTEPALRGRGHASALLDGVLARVGPGAQAVTLYSDVGEPLYARAGFRAVPAFDWRWPAASGDAAGVDRAESDAAVREALAGIPSPGELSLLAGVDQVGWHRERERAYAELLGRRPLAHGVLRTDGGAMLLAGDLKNGQLVVLDAHASHADAAERLARAAADEAATAGLREVKAWAAPHDPEPAWSEGLARVGGERVPRIHSLPMLRGPEPAAWRHVPRVQWV